MYSPKYEVVYDTSSNTKAGMRMWVKPVLMKCYTKDELLSEVAAANDLGFKLESFMNMHGAPIVVGSPEHNKLKDELGIG